MTSTRTKNVIKKIIMDRYGTDIHLKDDMKLEDDLMLDSLDYVEVWCGVEEEFLVNIDKKYEEEQLVTVGDVIALVEKVLKDKENNNG